jgi:SagB-type dehydrogenase family enzyme
MPKSTCLVALLLILLAVPLLSCAPGVSTEEYKALEAKLDKANSELAQTKGELAETKITLTEVDNQLTKAQTALNQANADLVKVQTSCLEVILSKRRSIRDYADSPLTKDEVMKLLWAGQGITGDEGKRAAPSAGPFYPLRIYVAVGNVTDLSPGVYRYKPEDNSLIRVKDGDVRTELADAALGQSWVKNGAIDIVIAAVYEETAAKYGEKAERFVHLEAGHAAQNICLEATALDLDLVTVGGFDDAKVAMTIGLSRNENPLYIIPVGRKK